jgi:hypothetical protein
MTLSEGTTQYFQKQDTEEAFTQVQVGPRPCNLYLIGYKQQ